MIVRPLAATGHGRFEYFFPTCKQTPRRVVCPGRQGPNLRRCSRCVDGGLHRGGQRVEKMAGTRNDRKK